MYAVFFTLNTSASNAEFVPASAKHSLSFVPLR
jgi:hypothetical protein